jgi:microcystin-dependent protein
MPTDLRFILLGADGHRIGELGSARQRHIEYTLNGAAAASFTLPGTHPDAKLIDELACDLLVWRDGQSIFRGRIGSSADTLSATDHSVTFTAIDYRGLLDRRILWADSPLSFRGVDQGQIAWAMIADTQRRPGGNLGIVAGAGTATGIIRDRDYEAGKKVGEAIAQLGEVIGGFDWEIDANLAFNVFYPYRGRTTGIDLVYGSQITGVNRTLTSTAFANAVRYSGDVGLAAVEVADTTFGPAGRWDTQVGNPDLKLQQSVVDAAAATLAASDDLIPGYHIELLEGWWDPVDLWLGDTAALFIRSGRLTVDGDAQRVVGITVAYDDSGGGGEKVTVDLGDLPPSMTGRLGNYQSRIEVIERSLTGPQGWILDAPVGSMFTWPGTAPPNTWGWADGSFYSKAHYPELFAVIGYTFTEAPAQGGDGFRVPDCRSRMVVGVGSGPGLSARGAGTVGGAETVALSGAQTGAHGHGLGLGGTVQPDRGHAHGFSGQSGTEDTNHTHAGATGVEGADHTHAGTTSVNSLDHTHNVPGGTLGAAPGSGAYVPVGALTSTSGGASQTHTHGITTGGRSGNHTHSFSSGNEINLHGHSYTGTTADQSQGHAHLLTGTTDTTAAAAGHENMPPWIAIGQVIRTLPPWRPTP